MEIGRVVSSSDHSDYLVQVHGPGDVPLQPTAVERGFGNFVDIPISSDRGLIGVIYSTQLLNPAYGAFGPRLSTQSELPVFSPDYLSETATLLGVSIVGSHRSSSDDDEFDQQTPTESADVDTPVHLLEESQFLAFHRSTGRVRLAYFPRLLARPFPSLPDLLCTILDRLIVAYPEEAARLKVARQNIRWRALIPAT